ncbi:MAG TPA: hypothetical protein VGC13_03980 [Longimicrobium sp.]|jgi:hypothetical protein|uniref:hypothetical protein n=1 Tax=Longimicrobium sp. TaxID=2029185 RepID=UPI002ED8C4E5
MKKLVLDTDSLRVESFEANSSAPDRGTVMANSTLAYTCTAQKTCNYTCEETCATHICIC